MRHRNKVKKLGSSASHRKAMLNHIAAALIEHHQIRTTLAKARAAQSFVEKLISYGKENTVHARRLAFKFLQNRTLVKMLFEEIATTFDDRKGGYTRIVKLGQRRGDGAHMAILQLVGFEGLTIAEETPRKKRKTKADTSTAAESTPAAGEKKAAEGEAVETKVAKPAAKKANPAKAAKAAKAEAEKKDATAEEKPKKKPAEKASAKSAAATEKSSEKSKPAKKAPKKEGDKEEGQ